MLIIPSIVSVALEAFILCDILYRQFDYICLFLLFFYILSSY